ncbi:MAG: heparinase II/III family protein [Paracoccaceae bacterium]|jgi:uncharacterized heparinase superfamily protein
MSDTFWKIRASVTRLDRANSAMWNRLRARRAKAKNVPTKFDHFPEPRTIGAFEVGHQLTQGQFYFAGDQIEASTKSIWSIDAPTPNFTAEMHGFLWLDDLAAVGDVESRHIAQAWTMDWITRYDSGKGAGWTPAMTGSRVLRICAHARFLFMDLEKPHALKVLRSLSRQLNYLGNSWKQEPVGRLRLEALAGLVFAGVSFEGQKKSLKAANKAIGNECARHIGENGGVPTRNPEELMEIFTLLTWVYRTLEDAGTEPDKRLVEALERIAPTLRGLRLGDGNLTRFHGGGRGREGQLDQVLSDSRVRKSRIGELAMGYDRLTAARITLLMDCASPPALPISYHAHASTLAFEMSSGRHPMVVNCGAGQKFSATWERKCRATVSHNTVAIGKISSSRIAHEGIVSQTFGERLLDTPKNVTRSRKADQQGSWLVATHDGYEKEFGLVHQRHLYLSPDGREFRGQDSLTATSDGHKKQYKRAIASVPSLGVAYTTHFHMHPDVKTKLSDDNKSVALQLPNKEVWMFRHEGGLLTLENSIFLDQWRHKPRATKQIVVTSRVLDYSDRITWIFKRVKDSET